MLEIGRGNGIALGVLGEILVLHYGETPTMAAARVLDLASNHPAMVRIGQPRVLIVIEPNARAPEANVRNATQKTLQRYESKTTAIAYAILGEGFAGAAARAVVSGMLLFVKPKYPAKVFATLSAASQWLLSQGPRGLPTERLELRDRLERVKQLEAIKNFCTCAFTESRSLNPTEPVQLDHA
jgi:hypothetical protein